jgi:hypothetical protein
LQSRLRILLALSLLLSPCAGWSAPPAIYSNPTHQSPVRADPDDLLLLPGYGYSSDDTVVYRAVTDSRSSLQHPDAIPSLTTATEGVAQIVSFVDAPYSLTVHWPAITRKDQTYAIWVLNARGEWSNGIEINDARPLWISPDEVYSSTVVPGLPRALKVVGRNLQPSSGHATLVRLTSPRATYTLQAKIDLPNDTAHDAALDHYVASIKLPTSMPPDVYRVEVRRDGTSWVTLIRSTGQREQLLTVHPDPPAPSLLRVGDYRFGNCDLGRGVCVPQRGHCTPDASQDGDATVCIVAAISAAARAGGGTVTLPRGRWLLNSPGTWTNGQTLSSKGVSRDGILVPTGVSLKGYGADNSILVRGSSWDSSVPAFALLGRNVVTDLRFVDQRVYSTAAPGSGFLRLGVSWNRLGTYALTSTSVSHVVISRNIFDKPFVAIDNAGLSIDHLVVADNEFGAFRTALFWEGIATNTTFQYHFSDSVVVHNRFEPGSYLDTSIGQGSIATELSGATRVDFSDNVADGSSTAYLYDPRHDARGWRAAFFWSMSDNVEELLVSDNTATCTGDKDGDGEALSYDNNHNRPGFARLAVPVLAATSNASVDESSITVPDPLITEQFSYGTSIDVQSVDRYYQGDWLQIVQGRGIGQARQIIAIQHSYSARGPTVTFVVTPALDVLPARDSLVMEGRSYWQAYTVNNLFDERRPRCLKSNRTRKAGGTITAYPQATDSVIEGNRQFDSSGIIEWNHFQLTDPPAGISFPEGFVQSFNEVRGNLIDGDYTYHDTTPLALGGIALTYAATPDTAPPPVLSYGLVVARNTIIRAGTSKGAIAFTEGWYTGPSSRAFPHVTPWKIADATMVFGNVLKDIGDLGAHSIAIGISAEQLLTPIEWHTVLYNNTCEGRLPAEAGIVDQGTQSIAWCPVPNGNSCSCRGTATDVAITSPERVLKPSRDNSITARLVVTNNGRARAAAVTLAVDTGAGLRVVAARGGGAICALDEAGINLCRLGDIEPGVSIALQIVARLETRADSSMVVSVAHHNPDPQPRNDTIQFGIDDKPFRRPQ